MAQVAGSEDVYRRTVEESNQSWLLGLLAFAIVEEQRIEWMKHFAEHNGRTPDEADVRNWYEQQPEGVLRRASSEAENALQLFADDVLQEVLEVERRRVAEGVIVGEVRLARRFWPQFGISAAGGFVSALVFAAVLAILAFVVWQDPSPVQLGRNAVGDAIGDQTDGEAPSEQRADE
jgi:hypothetical protein